MQSQRCLFLLWGAGIDSLSNKLVFFSPTRIVFSIILMSCSKQRYERDASRLARSVVSHWKRYVRRKKQGNPMVPPSDQPAIAAVVEEAMEATETSGLLS
jgi:hypothetical protein